MYSASVIIPVYNAEKTLRKCVEALCYGEERNIEIILIDDCSKDNSWELCQTLADEYSNIQCYQNEHNSGVSATRNHGLEKATAAYVLFVDSDDWTSSCFASSLLASAARNKDALSICGYEHIDHISSGSHVYIYGTESVDKVDVADAFSLFEHVLLQQLWNKIFRRDLIEKHHIRFDETQSMGEDFQFVLDYLEAAKIQTCVVLNQPLYYYIRWNNNSLMSKFGFIDIQPEFDRMEQLGRIAGAGAKKRKDAMIAQIKQNYVYHIARSAGRTRQEKLDAIRCVMGDEREQTHYRKQRILQAKERLVAWLSWTKQLLPRLRGRLHRKRLQRTIARAVDGVKAEGVTLLSQNCIGGVLYHDLGLPFLSPTINTFIPEPGFVKLAQNPRHYMEQGISMSWGETYPIGVLDDVQIHFMHYDTCQEAKAAWDRRTERINWDKIVVIGTDRDGFDEAVYEQWKKISYPKVLFTAHPEFTEDAICFPEFAAEGQVGDLIHNRVFYKGGKLVALLQ